MVYREETPGDTRAWRTTVQGSIPGVSTSLWIVSYSTTITIIMTDMKVHGCGANNGAGAGINGAW